jgi:hypothetical protein
MKMKKFALAFLLLFSILSLSFGAESVSTVIQGIVPELLTIGSDLVATTNVDVFNSESTILGFINIFSNRAGNWTITVASTNGGAMRGISAGNNDSYPYTLTFGSREDISLSSPFVFNMSGRTTSEGSAYQLGIDYQNFWDLSTPVSPDTYRDTLTVTIAAS